MRSSSSSPPGSRWRTSAPGSTQGSVCGARDSRSTARSRWVMSLPMPLPEMPWPDTPPDFEADAAAFEEWRSLLFGIAYRMLGSAADAEDVVQDASIRWLRRRDEETQSVCAYLC